MSPSPYLLFNFWFDKSETRTKELWLWGELACLLTTNRILSDEIWKEGLPWMMSTIWNYLFTGHENFLHKQSYYSFTCDFHFGHFLFDLQICKLNIFPTPEFVEILPLSRLVNDSSTEVGSFGNISALPWAPTIFLNMLSQSTNYFGDTNEIFDAVIGANLTIMQTWNLSNFLN